MISEKLMASWNSGEAALLLENADIEITEVHGLICGMIAGGCENNVSAYMPSVVNTINSGEAFGESVKSWLVEFFDLLSRQYREMETLDFPFEDRLTTPDDAVYYLSMWASAFLLGFGCSFGSEELSSSGRELLEEISSFTQVESENIESEEEFDSIVTTLQEHLKVCAMSLYADYGAVTGGRIPGAESAGAGKSVKGKGPIRDGELVIGEEGVHLSDLLGGR
ncbi:MAG: UPF0149 family protein [Succinivibrionaceae bacterium]|nr:UPF0149 family protein [Succinivibrionaceae bacterium]